MRATSLFRRARPHAPSPICLLSFGRPARAAPTWWSSRA
nr:MAG TPA: hypothetical protein [Caudoviricetes sp.]